MNDRTSGTTMSVVIHGHFYQPPREDPWLETLETQPTAAPFHDWNERIERECYRPVSAARVAGRDGRIAEIVNTLEFISFDFGPTLLEWMEEHAPEVYRAVLTADASSRRARRGHGNALAQAYHHTILPLATRREKVSEIRWGIADFRRRFGREPAGMWLPETAVDRETLEVLAQEGIAFTILAPHQVRSLPPRGLPGRFTATTGRSLAVFLYGGALSHDVAFGSLSGDAAEWERRILADAAGAGGQARRLVSVATDGETYGHHHRFGEMGLAAVLGRLKRRSYLRVENFASFLQSNPPEQEVEIVGPSSWSCPHGVERWRSECGCKMDPSVNTQQRWRAGLREAMDWLAGRLHEVFQREGPHLLGDPWTARNLYGKVAAASPEEGFRFLAEIAPRPLEPRERTRAMELLEMERNALRLFTSCGWFFDDLAGIEPRQVLRYAARAMELAAPSERLEEQFLRRLHTALSNETPPRTGGAVYLEDAKPGLPAHLRVAAGAAGWGVARTTLLNARRAPVGGPAGLNGSSQVKPGVPGYRVSREAGDVLRVRHRRTGRTWGVQYHVSLPTPAGLEVAVRTLGDEAPLVPVALEEIPEAYRFPIVRSLVEGALTALHAGEPEGWPSVEPETTPAALGRALIAAIHTLDAEPLAGAPEPRLVVEMIRDLAGLHQLLGLPIPFDAQTDFYRLLGKPSGSIAEGLSTLREPLGFEPQE